MPMLNEKETKEYRDFLDEITSDYCPEGCYCILKEFLISSHPSRITLAQLKVIDRFKFIWSKESKKDIGWKIAFEKYISEGIAKKFRDVYSDTKTEKQIFKEIIGK